MTSLCPNTTRQLIFDDHETDVIIYRGTWVDQTQGSGPQALQSATGGTIFENTLHGSSTIGDNFSISFSGTSITVMGTISTSPPSTSSGNITLDWTCSLDGTLFEHFTLNSTFLSNTGFRNNVPLCQSPCVQAGDHSLTVSVTSAGAQDTLWVDSFSYANGFGSSPSVDFIPVGSSTPGTLGGGLVRVEIADESITTDGNWQIVPLSSLQGEGPTVPSDPGLVLQSTAHGAKLGVQYSGRGLTWYGETSQLDTPSQSQNITATPSAFVLDNMSSASFSLFVLNQTTEGPSTGLFSTGRLGILVAQANPQGSHNFSFVYSVDTNPLDNDTTPPWISLSYLVIDQRPVTFFNPVGSGSSDDEGPQSSGPPRVVIAVVVVGVVLLLGLALAGWMRRRKLQKKRWSDRLAPWVQDGPGGADLERIPSGHPQEGAYGIPLTSRPFANSRVSRSDQHENTVGVDPVPHKTDSILHDSKLKRESDATLPPAFRDSMMSPPPEYTGAGGLGDHAWVEELEKSGKDGSSYYPGDQKGSE